MRTNELRGDKLKDQRGGAEERKSREREEGTGMQAGADGGSGGAFTKTHKINVKVVRKIPYRPIFNQSGVVF